MAQQSLLTSSSQEPLFLFCRRFHIDGFTRLLSIDGFSLLVYEVFFILGL